MIDFTRAVRSVWLILDEHGLLDDVDPDPAEQLCEEIVTAIMMLQS